MTPGRMGVWGVAFGFTGVAAGAFGAHGLDGRLAPGSLETFEVAVRYQMYHALALVAGAALGRSFDGPALRWAGRLFTAGVVVFAGSLYALALSGVGWLGAITPIGGVCFLAGWIALATAMWPGARRDGAPAPEG